MMPLNIYPISNLVLVWNLWGTCIIQGTKFRPQFLVADQQEPTESCYNLVSVAKAGANSLYKLVSASMAGVNCLSVDYLTLFLLVLVISFCVLGLMTFLDIGQTESTLLNILVNHWREVRERGENLSVVVKKGKLVTLWSSEWPTFGVGWLPVGTFDLQVIKAVEERVFRPGSLRHSAQVPYIVTWKDLVEDPYFLDKSLFVSESLSDPGHEGEEPHRYQ